MRNLIMILTLLCSALLLNSCGYNTIQKQDEEVKAQWSEVLNQYQRRADLVPNLVATVKGFAAQEERVLVEVTNARASVGKVNISAEQAADPEALKKFQAAQGELSGALSGLTRVRQFSQDDAHIFLPESEIADEVQRLIGLVKCA